MDPTVVGEYKVAVRHQQHSSVWGHPPQSNLEPTTPTALASYSPQVSPKCVLSSESSLRSYLHLLCNLMSCFDTKPHPCPGVLRKKSRFPRFGRPPRVRVVLSHVVVNPAVSIRRAPHLAPHEVLHEVPVVKPDAIRSPEEKSRRQVLKRGKNSAR